MSVHVPVPLIIVTVAVALAGVPPTAPTAQTPAVPAMVGITPALVAAVTPKLVLYAALAGAPVKVVVGTACVAVVVWVSVAPA